jgi:hypothetical protein
MMQQRMGQELEGPTARWAIHLWNRNLLHTRGKIPDTIEL